MIDINLMMDCNYEATVCACVCVHGGGGGIMVDMYYNRRR